MNTFLRNALAVAGMTFATQAAAEITFYEHESFGGRSFTAQQPIDNFERNGFNDRASSVVVVRDQWEVCEHVQFGGQCAVLSPGRYPSLASMGLNDRVSSVRAVSPDARIEDRRHAPAQVTFYENEGLRGRSFTTHEQIDNFERSGFRGRASSVEVLGERWEICENPQFRGRCVILRPGRYPSLSSMGLNDRVSSVRAVNRDARIDDNRYAPAPVAAQVTFFESEGFRGQSFTTQEQVINFERSGFNDRASSVEVLGERWEVCENARFRGRCVVLRPGRYVSLASMGLNDRISSVRAVNRDARIDDNRYAPAPVAGPDYRRRNNERLYEANVTSVRAVVGTPEQRCWIEREQIPQERSSANIPAAIAGAIIGGILGHQVGGGSGQDIATAGGAVAGAAVGANIGRFGGTHQAQTQDVQRCENLPSQARPDYWDVTYTFRGREHRVQLTAPPGRTVIVNEQGEPRA